MGIVRADGWAAWYVEVPRGRPNVNADTPVELDEHGLPPRRRMMSVPLVVWREYANGGVMGLVTAEADADNAHLLTPAPDLVIVGPVERYADGPVRYVFSHYDVAPIEGDHL